jgi:TIGR03009 family protein
VFATTARFIVVTAALVAGSLLLVPNADAQPGILDNRVDVLLREWSERTGTIKSMYAEFTRTTIDKVFRNKEEAKGSARYLQPNKARLDIEGEESFVLTGKEIWHYRIALKQIKVFQLPPDAAEAQDIQDGPLPFLFGAKPDKAKARYNFRILKEDDRVVHVEVLPKLREDQQNFSQAEIWLNKENFQPNQLKFVEANGNEIVFDFKKIWTNININESDFSGKAIDGWQVIVQKLANGQQPEEVKLR